MNPQESQDKKKPKFQIQLEKEELDIWKNFAKLYHRGNLSRMIRTLVNRSILETDLEELDGSSSKLDRVVKSIHQDSQRTSDKVDSLESDLTIIKNLLSKLLQTQSRVIMEYQTSISVPLEDMVYQRVYEFVESKERKVLVEEILPYLLETSIEAKRFLAKEDQNLPAGGKIALSFILEDVLKQLYEKTNNPAYNGEFDKKPGFRRSKYDF